ncbi:MAG: hypothetical protein KF748_03955 [Xanthobacteraceae bacterium]|nr:hypothetical protein [Xanthobacteraceae bacterium]
MNTKDRSKISFEEAEGKSKYPDFLKWGELDNRIRSAIWNALYASIFFDGIDEHTYSVETFYEQPLHDILLREFIHRQHGFANEFKASFQGKNNALATWSNFFRDSDYVEVFGFLTYFLRDRECPKNVLDTVKRALDTPWSPYRLIIADNIPTIMPVTSPEEKATLEADLAKVFSSKFSGARTHLKNALDALNAGNFRDVVREAVHSIESATKQLANNDSATLTTALKKLRDENKLHPALAGAFEKLYAYTSDEKGVRHALVLADNEKVGFSEAVFFLSACSAFVAFLSRSATEA